MVYAIEVLPGAGIRLGERVGLDVDDVDFDARHPAARKKHTKGPDISCPVPDA